MGWGVGFDSQCGELEKFPGACKQPGDESTRAVWRDSVGAVCPDGVPSDAQLMEREQQQALPASKPGEPPPTTPQPPKADQGSWGAHGRDTSKVGPRKVCGYFSGQWVSRWERKRK